MSNKNLAGDHNKDGLVNDLDTFTFIFRMVSPYMLIAVGLFAPVPDDTRQWVIAGGLGLAGTGGDRRKTEIVVPPQNWELPEGNSDPEWY